METIKKNEEIKENLELQDENEHIVIDIIESAFGSTDLIERTGIDLIERTGIDLIERT